MSNKVLKIDESLLEDITYKIRIKRYFTVAMGVNNIEKKLLKLLEPGFSLDDDYVYLEKTATPETIKSVEELLNKAGELLKETGMPYTLLKNEGTIDKVIYSTEKKR
jgi:hypothetical protein